MCKALYATSYWDVGAPFMTQDYYVLRSSYAVDRSALLKCMPYGSFRSAIWSIFGSVYASHSGTVCSCHKAIGFLNLARFECAQLASVH